MNLRTKRLAQIAFWLFLLKGLAWLALPTLLVFGSEWF